MKRWRLFTALFCGALLAGTLAAIFFVVFAHLPAVESLQNYQPTGTTRIVDVHGTVIGEIYHERRLPVPLESMPKELVQTVVAVEDSGFFSHPGISLRGILRALVKNILRGRISQGGSTLTQQLAKVLFLTPKKTLIRKMKEALLAFQIEKHYSKDEILEMYLNQIYFGEGNYGVAAATSFYFCKELEELSPSEIALLAGLPKGPNLFAPTRNPDRAKKRRDFILQLMAQQGLISAAALDQAIRQPLDLKPCTSPGINSHINAWIVGQLIEELGENRVLKGELRAVTTIDAALQKQAQEAVLQGLRLYAKRHANRVTNDPLDHDFNGPEAAAIAIDAFSGEIRALVGGRKFSASQFNRVTQAKRQVGSAFKPIVFTTAIESGNTQATIVEDVRVSYPDGRGGQYVPQNYSHDFLGPLTLRTALEKSRNTVAVQLAAQLGVGTIRKTAQRLGIRSAIPNNLTMAIGSASLTLLELTAAYMPLVANGTFSTPHSLLRVEGKEGELLVAAKVNTHQVLSTDVAYVMNDMLTGVLEQTAGLLHRSLSCHAGGKTGTTNRYTDALFVGFAGSLVIGVRMGYDDNRPLGDKESGARAALPIWQQIVTWLCSESGTMRHNPKTTLPANIVRLDIDRSSGLLATHRCPDRLSAAFIKGSQPTTHCTEELP